MLFEKRTTIIKRNHRYYGPTESYKMATTLDETSVDINNVYGQFNSQQLEFDAVASGYLAGSGSLIIMDGFVRDLEDRFDKMVFIHATQEPIY